MTYAGRALENWPGDAYRVGGAVRRMSSYGYSDGEIGQILGLAPEAIRAARANQQDASHRRATCRGS